MDRLQFADRAVENQFAETLEIRKGMTLRTVLRRNLRLALQVICADGARLFHEMPSGFSQNTCMSRFNAQLAMKAW